MGRGQKPPEESAPLKGGIPLRNAITAQQLTENAERLEPLQKQAVFEFVTFLLSKRPLRKVGESKDLLLQVSVWTEQDIDLLHQVQQDTKTWRIPALS